MLKLPDQERVLEAIKTVQGLSKEEIDKAISLKIGDPMMGGFSFVAQNMFADEPDEALVIERVRLMVYGWLLCAESFDQELTAGARGAPPTKKRPPPKK